MRALLVAVLLVWVGEAAAEDAPRYVMNSGTPVVLLDTVTGKSWILRCPELVACAYQWSLIPGGPAEAPDYKGWTIREITPEEAKAELARRARVHEKLEDKSEYGLRPIGTGPIKLEKLDQNVTVVPFTENKHHEQVKFKRMIGMSIRSILSRNLYYHLVS